jgi:hypothetical protein
LKEKTKHMAVTIQGDLRLVSWTESSLH